MKSPVIKPPPFTSFFGRKRKKRQTKSKIDDPFGDFQDITDSDFFTEEDDSYYDDPFNEPSEDDVDSTEYFSVALYPETYCNIVNDLGTIDILR